MQRFKRSDRVSELLRREISLIIDHEMRDKRLGMVTVTGVDMSRDLKNAKIFVSVLGNDEEKESSVTALNSAVHYIRSLLGERVILRYLPNISFFYDTSTDYGMHIDELLEKIKQTHE